MLRYPLVRLVRRAASHRLLALAVFALAAAAQFWAMRAPVSAALPASIVAAGGATLKLVDVVGAATVFRHQVRGPVDVRIDRARVAPASAALLARLGVALPDDDAAVSWVTTAGEDAVSVVDVARAGETATTLAFRAAASSATALVQLELEAEAPLDVMLGTPFVPGAPAPRKLLRIGTAEVALDAALPLRFSVPQPAALRAVLPAPPGGEPLSIRVGGEPSGAAARGVAVVDSRGRATWSACAAPAGQVLWRGAASIAGGRCDARDTLQVEALRLSPGRLDARLGGTGWVVESGGAAGPVLFERIVANPALASLVAVIDALLALWVALAVLSLRRVARHRVFVSYRRDDAAGHAGRLTARLAEILGDGAVFLDVERIPPGAYFDDVIARRIDDAETVLVVIGPDWLTASDAGGQRRLDAPQDFVRREIERAFVRDKRVIPVLVGGAAMPAAAALPESIRALARCNAAVVAHASFERDADALAAELDGGAAAMRAA